MLRGVRRGGKEQQRDLIWRLGLLNDQTKSCDLLQTPKICPATETYTLGSTVQMAYLNSKARIGSLDQKVT